MLAASPPLFVTHEGTSGFFLWLFFFDLKSFKFSKHLQKKKKPYLVSDTTRGRDTVINK